MIIDQCNRIDNLKIHTHTRICQLIFNSSAKVNQWEKKVISTTDAGKTRYPYEKRKVSLSTTSFQTQKLIQSES